MKFFLSIFISIQLFVACIVVANAAHAWEYKLLRHNHPEEGLYSDFVTGVCTAMEENFKRYKDRPYGMACHRELDPALGFTRPKWESLDIAKHIPLTIAIIKYARLESWLPPDPKQWEARLKEMAEKENLTLELTRIDLNRDGKPDNLVRFGYGWPCDPKEEIETSTKRWNKHRRLLVIDLALTNVDDSLSRGTAVHDDVFLYKGIIYTDTFSGLTTWIRNGRQHDGTYWISEFSRHGVAKICTFHYFDSSASKGGKQK